MTNLWVVQYRELVTDKWENFSIPLCQNDADRFLDREFGKESEEWVWDHVRVVKYETDKG